MQKYIPQRQLSIFYRDFRYGGLPLSRKPEGLRTQKDWDCLAYAHGRNVAKNMRRLRTWTGART